MFGLLLAGGTGSRLRPLTLAVNKHLLPVYDKPMIHYPITTLLLAGVTEIGVVVNPGDLDSFRQLLGSGNQFGIKFQFLVQSKPLGIADALNLVPSEKRNNNLWVILGDNFFFGRGLGREFSEASSLPGCSVFGYSVSDARPYGVVEFRTDGSVSQIIEKPVGSPPSNIAVAGLYRFDTSVFEMLSSVVPSKRGELEITSLLNAYAAQESLELRPLPRGTIWMDLGSHEMLHEASTLVKIVQARTGLAIGDPVEAAQQMKLIRRD